uniref:Trafficking protein particle complex subunit n=1 Tax=Globodera pallida TaxID=36090 RepID=A0A183C1T0_GLOPA
MTVFHVFVINRAGSLIYDWENRRAVDPQIAPLSTNEKIVLASVFHSLYTIATQLSPASKSTGIEVLETSQFKLQCFQSITGVKFVVILVNTYTNTQNVEPLLRKIYELYADYALKNPFYSVDMPIRADKFEAGLRALVDRILLTAAVTMSKQLGYMLIQNGAIAKSEGDLVNAERLASVVLRMVAVGPFFAPSANNAISSLCTSGGGDQPFRLPGNASHFDRLSILFPDHQYDIVVGSGGGGISIGGGRQSQQQKQVIHVVKRTLPLLPD